MAEFRKVRPGQGLSIPAADYNAMMDAAAAHQASQFNGGSLPTFQPRAGDIIKVKNSSGSARQRYDVLAVSDPLVTPTDGASEFRRQVALDATTPASGDEGLWVVLLDPLADGAIGRAVAAGVAQVRIDVTSGTASYTQAEITDGETTLVLSATGSAKVLWRESGTSGTKWAVVRIGATAAASSVAGDETGVAFPQTGRDYVSSGETDADWEFGRYRDASGIADETFYPAAELVVSFSQNVSTSQSFTEDVYYMLPFVPIRGTITRIAVPGGQANNGTIRVGIYTDKASQAAGGAHYPDSLVYETTSLTWYEGDPQSGADFGGIHTTAAINVSVTPRALHWIVFCYEYTTTHGRFAVLGANQLRPVLGFGHALRYSTGGMWITGLVGLYYSSGGVSIPSAAFPNPFTGSVASPASGLQFIVNNATAGVTGLVTTAPLIFLGYGA